MKRTIKELKYALYLIKHPFKAYWDIKFEQEGSLKTAIIIMIIFNVVLIGKTLFTGYLFGGVQNVNYNLFSTISASMSIFLIWCSANWSLTCLSDGKGRFKDICIATAYALVPYILIQIPMILLSNIFVLREIMFYNILNGFSLVWCGLLILVGQIMTHQYTLIRALVVIVFTIVGMLAIICLILLFFNLLQQVVIFISIVADEVSMRLIH